MIEIANCPRPQLSVKNHVVIPLGYGSSEERWKEADRDPFDAIIIDVLSSFGNLCVDFGEE